MWFGHVKIVDQAYVERKILDSWYNLEEENRKTEAEMN